MLCGVVPPGNKNKEIQLQFMKKSFISYGLAAATTLAMSVSAFAGSDGSHGQSSSSTRPGGSESSDSKIHSSGTETSWSSSQLSATGRSSEHAVRGSKLMGAQVKDSSGSSICTIEDVILNPSSGRIDFAVISRTGSGSSSGLSSGSSTSDGTAGAHTQNTGTGEGANSGSTYSSGSQGGTASGSGTTYGSGASTTQSSSGKLIPVPWSLLQPASGSSSASTMGQQSFTLSVNQSKLDSAPSLSRGSWSEISQSGWSQRINSHYGVTEGSTGRSSVGGSESSSGSSSGSESSNSSTDPSKD
jgi:sporulation protein YlmC with PRC-barrel domain